jgi:hypothetical protein
MTEGRKPGFIAVRHIERSRTPPPIIVVKFKRASEWESGKDKLRDELRGYSETLSGLSGYNTVYGVGGIDLHWMA